MSHILHGRRTLSLQFARETSVRGLKSGESIMECELREERENQEKP